MVQLLHAMQCIYLLSFFSVWWHRELLRTIAYMISPVRPSTTCCKCFSFHCEQCGDIFYSTVVQLFYDLHRNKNPLMESPAGDFSTEGCGVKSVNTNECLDSRSCLKHNQLSTKLHSSKRGGLSQKTGNHLNPFIVTHSHSTRQVKCYA